jgi:hypothetical protein
VKQDEFSERYPPLEVDKKFVEAGNLLDLYRMYKTVMYFLYNRKKVLDKIFNRFM